MTTLRQRDARHGYNSRQINRIVETLCNAAPVTPEKEQEWGRLVWEGDKDAQGLLVLHNMRFVVSCALSIAASKIDLDDAVSAGIEGALVAAGKFKPGHGRFISYAVHYIYRWITKETLLSSTPVRVPHNYTTHIKKIRDDYTEFLDWRGSAPSQKDMMALGASAAQADAALVAYAAHASLDAPLGDDTGTTHADMLVSEGEPADYLAELNSDWKMMEGVMRDVLTDRERRVLMLRWGIGFDGDPMTLEEIGDVFGFTRERARQLCDKALWRLQVRAGSAKWTAPPKCIKSARDKAWMAANA